MLGFLFGTQRMKNPLNNREISVATANAPPYHFFERNYAAAE